MAAFHRTIRDLASKKEIEPLFLLPRCVIPGSGLSVSTCWTSAAAAGLHTEGTSVVTVLW